ncbi:MAG: peptide deformylase [Acidimicrobiaceae bacterium]|jgi:peptide deformylase
MTVREILHIGHPVLRQTAEPVDPHEMQALITDLIDTMRAADGAGLAANQIGEPVQVCVIEVRPGSTRYPYKPEIPLTVLINPVIEAISTETFANYEGCLSVPDLRGVVDRAVEVRVKALGRDGGPIDTVVRGLSAGTFQHETDHLQGTLFIDRVTDPHTLCTWSEFHERYEAAFVDQVRALVDRFGS